MTKTGEAYRRDEDGTLFRCESFVDADGVVSTVETKVEE